MRVAGCVLGLTLTLWTAALAGERPLEVGAKGIDIEGEVKAGDPVIKITFMGKETPMPAKQFSLRLQPGLRYRFTLDTDSATFDPFLVLKDKKGELLVFDDDGGGKLNSMFTFTPAPSADDYQLFAASLDGKAGPFRLIIQPQGKVFFDPKTREFDGKELRIEGELSDERQEIAYLVKLAGGKRYRIDMTSKRFDAYLELRDEAGRLLAENDDRAAKGDDRFNARITRNISSDGVFRIVASSPNLRQTGPFVLEIRAE